jgi:hypothetical protein
MRNLLQTILPVMIYCLPVISQVPSIEWEKSFGGTSDDVGKSICYTINNDGFIIAAISESSNGSIPHIGYEDFFILRIDSLGNLIWMKAYGSSSHDKANSVKTRNNSYLITGSAGYNDGDVSGGYHGVYDFWTISIDPYGFMQWQICIGGTDPEEANDLFITNDSNVILIGGTSSYDFDVQGMHGGEDMFVVKLSSGGVIKWTRALGGWDYERGNSGMQMQNGNYLLAGTAGATDGDVTGNHNNSSDVWLVELDTAGVLIRQKCFGGSAIDNAFKVLEAPNGDIIFAATTSSTNGDVQNNLNGIEEFWIVRIDSAWNIIWEKCYGGPTQERVKSACLTPDGGVLVIGQAGFNGGQVSGSHGYLGDYWAVKTDSMGNFEWGKCMGGTGEDIAYDIKPTVDGGYIIVGSSNSNDGDVTGNNGMKDIWVVKLSNPTAGITVPENGLIDFKVFQQNDQLIVRFFSKNYNQAQLRLLDLNGKQISTDVMKIQEGINFHSLNCSGLAPGMYHIEIIGKNVRQYGKVVIWSF